MCDHLIFKKIFRIIILNSFIGLPFTNIEIDDDSIHDFIHLVYILQKPSLPNI